MKPVLVLSTDIFTQTCMGGTYAWSAFLPMLFPVHDWLRITGPLTSGLKCEPTSDYAWAIPARAMVVLINMCWTWTLLMQGPKHRHMSRWVAVLRKTADQVELTTSGGSPL